MKRRAKYIEVSPGIVTSRKFAWKPRIADAWMAPEVLTDMFAAGESPAEVADWFNITEDQVIDAIRWRLLSRHQRYRRIKKAKSK